MCRLLLIRAQAAQEIAAWLRPFAEMCRVSPEFQGHGWGLVWRDHAGNWQEHKQLEPIWDCVLSGFGSSDFVIVHARSAFRDEGIELANNMPFRNDRHIFIFNGELRGVRLARPGRIGAEKIFNTILGFHKGDLAAAFRRATELILARSAYVRALNMLMTDGERIYLASHFSETPEYFTLHRQQGDGLEAICSQPLAGHWQTIDNATTLVL